MSLNRIIYLSLLSGVSINLSSPVLASQEGGIEKSEQVQIINPMKTLNPFHDCENIEQAYSQLKTKAFIDVFAPAFNVDTQSKESASILEKDLNTHFFDMARSYGLNQATEGEIKQDINLLKKQNLFFELFDLKVEELKFLDTLYNEMLHRKKPTSIEAYPSITKTEELPKGLTKAIFDYQKHIKTNKQRVEELKKEILGLSDQVRSFLNSFKDPFILASSIMEADRQLNKIYDTIFSESYADQTRYTQIKTSEKYHDLTYNASIFRETTDFLEGEAKEKALQIIKEVDEIKLEILSLERKLPFYFDMFIKSTPRYSSAVKILQMRNQTFLEGVHLINDYLKTLLSLSAQEAKESLGYTTETKKLSEALDKLEPNRSQQNNQKRDIAHSFYSNEIPKSKMPYYAFFDYPFWTGNGFWRYKGNTPEFVGRLSRYKVVCYEFAYSDSLFSEIEKEMETPDVQLYYPNGREYSDKTPFKDVWYNSKDSKDKKGLPVLKDLSTFVDNSGTYLDQTSLKVGAVLEKLKNNNKLIQVAKPYEATKWEKELFELTKSFGLPVIGTNYSNHFWSIIDGTRYEYVLYFGNSKITTEECIKLSKK